MKFKSGDKLEVLLKQSKTPSYVRATSEGDTEVDELRFGKTGFGQNIMFRTGKVVSINGVVSNSVAK